METQSDKRDTTAREASHLLTAVFLLGHSVLPFVFNPFAVLLVTIRNAAALIMLRGVLTTLRNQSMSSTGDTWSSVS